MADFKNGIRLSVKLDTKNQVESELNKLVSELNKNKIELNINTDNLRKNLKDAFNLDGITKSAYSSAKVFEKEMDNLADSMAKVREQSNKKSNNDYLKSEEIQAKAINKALEEQYKLSLKEAEAQKQVESEIQKQIKLLEIRKQGMLSSNSKADTSAIDGAIEKYEQLNNVNMKTLRNEISYINAELKESSSTAETFGSKLAGSLSKIGIYINATDIFRGIINGAKDAVNYVMDVENSMIDLRRVVTLSDSQAQSFQDSMHNLSVEMASTNADTISTVASFSKLGYSLQDATKLGEVTSKYNFAADINNIEDATLSLISTLKAYKIEAEGAEDVTNDINEVSNKYAVTAQDINGILQRSASTMSTFGNSLKQNISLGTVAQEITQDSERVGNALKSIGARITTNSNALDELEKMGVSIEDVNGNLKSTYDIFKEMSPLIQNMKGSELARVSSNLFGKNQLSVGLAIVQNYEKLDEVMKTLGNTTDSVNKEFDRYLDSTQAKVSQLKENMGGLYSQFINSNMTKGTVDGLNSFVTSITSVISKIGALPTIIATVVGSLTIFNSKFREMSTAYQPTKITEFIGKLNGLSSVYKSQIVSINENIIAQKTQIATQNQTGLAFVTSRVKLLGYQTQLGVATVAENACAIGAKALGVAFNMALGVGVGFVIQGLMEFANASETAKQKNEELLSTIQQTKTDISTISELESQFKSINKALQSGTLTDDEALQKKKDLKGIYDQLIQACPQLEGALSLENGKYVDNIKLIEQAIKLKQDQLKLDTEKYLTDNDVNDKGIQNQIDKIKELQESIQSFSGKSLMTDSELVDSGNMTIFGKMFGSGDDRRKYFEQLKNDSKQELIDLQNDLQNELAKINSAEKMGIKIGVSEESKNNISQSIEEISKILNNESQSLDDNTNSIKLNSDGIKLLKQAQEELNSVGVVSKDTLDELNKVCPELGINAQNASEILDDMSGAIDEAGDSADKASTSLENLSKEFNGLSNTNSDIDSVIEDIKSLGGITEQTYSKIIDNPAILQALTSEGDTIQNLTKLQEENRQSMEDRIQQAVDTANGVNSSQQSEADSKVDTDNQKQQSDSNTNNQIRKNTSDTTTQNSENYSKDGGNFDSTSQAKNTSDFGFQSAWRGNTADSVNEMGDMYQTDYSNFKNATEAKNALLENFRTNLASMGSVFSNAEDAINPLVNDLTKPWNIASGNSEGLAKSLDNAFGTDSLNAMKEYKNGLSQIASTFDSITGKKITTGNVQAPSIKKVSSSSAPAMVKGDTGSGSKGGSSGSSGKSDAEKAEEERQKYMEKLLDLQTSLNVETDRYFEINNSLDWVNAELEQIEQSKESLSGSELAEATIRENELKQQQIDLQQQLIDKKKEEASETRTLLEENGFMVDGHGQLINTTERLNQMTEKLKATQFDFSEQGIDAFNEQKQKIDDLKSATESYTKMINSEIPSAILQYKKLTSAIDEVNKTNVENLRNTLVGYIKEDLQKELENTISDLEEAEENDISDLEEEKQSMIDSYDKKIASLREELNALDDDSEDKQKKLAKLQNELKLWQNDNSVYSKSKQQELNTQIADLQKDIRKDELNSQIEDLEEQRDNESDDYDERIDSLNDYYDKKKKIQQDANDDALIEEQAYAKADKLLKEQNLSEIEDIMSSHAENFKDIGSLLGTNFSEALTLEIQTALDSLDNLLRKYDIDVETNSSSNSSNGVDLGTGATFYPSNSSNKSSTSNTSSNGIDLGTGATFYPARYASGGETPKNMDKNGEWAILDGEEKILNRDENKNLKDVYSVVDKVMDSLPILDEIKNMANDINTNGITMPSYVPMNYNPVNGISDLNKLVSTTNNSNDNSKVEINNEFNITNEKQVQADRMPNNISKLLQNEARSYGLRKR